MSRQGYRGSPLGTLALRTESKPNQPLVKLCKMIIIPSNGCPNCELGTLYHVVCYFAHVLPPVIEELPPGLGQSDSSLLPRAQHMDPLSEGLLYLLQSHSITSALLFSPNHNEDHFALKTSKRRYLREVHSSVCGYDVCLQNRLLREFYEAVLLTLFLVHQKRE